MKYIVVLTVLATALSGDAQAQENCSLPPSITVDSGQGDNMNRSSSLARESLAILDTDLPINFQRLPAVTTRYVDRGYRFRSDVSLYAEADVTALNVRFLTFDVFGERQTTLGATEIVDIATGEQRAFNWQWRTTANDAEEHFASLAFVARVRTADGQVHQANYETVLCVAELYALSVTIADLDPPGDANEE